MHARIARFEGGDASRIDEQIAEMRSQITETRSGGLPDNAPEELRTLVDTVSRFVHLVDRKTGASVGISFCETEEEMRRADDAMNAMSPDQGGGRRTSVEIYEVALDESFR
ncbi:MAG: hypothetical protein H0U08_06205 [Actinobacteria bacterium]|nr:hypothetical protein [Actinomycetota bacterium]